MAEKALSELADIGKDGVITPEEALSPSQLTERTVFDFLEKVWDYNDRDSFIEEIGQTKSITGEAWVKVQYVAPEDLDDPFGEYPKGKIRLSVTPTQYVFPEFDQHDTKKLNTLLIMYPIERREQTGILKNRTTIKTIISKEYWTKDEIKVYDPETDFDSIVLNSIHVDRTNKTLNGLVYAKKYLGTTVEKNISPFIDETTTKLKSGHEITISADGIEPKTYKEEEIVNFPFEKDIKYTVILTLTVGEKKLPAKKIIKF